MGFRFRRSIKIAPGLRLNVGKKGVSLSAGVRGARVSVGSSGTYANMGVPGTGISYRHKIGTSVSSGRLTSSDFNKESAVEQLSVKISLADSGSVTATRQTGEPLTAAELRKTWEQQGDGIRQWLLGKADEINGDVKRLCSIHQNTPDPDQVPEYEEIRFSEAPPEAPEEPKLPSEPKAPVAPKPPIAARLLQSKRVKFDEEQEKRRKQFNLEYIEWQQKVRDLQRNFERRKEMWQSERSDWMKRYKSHKAEESRRKENFETLIRSDLETMQTTLNARLTNTEWPRETLVDYDLGASGREIWIDVDLPEIEDLPNRVAELAASGKKLSIKNKAQKQLRLEYAAHIHGIAFRIVGMVFATLPAADLVVLSGYSQRQDPATGKENDEYLFSAKFTRNGIREIDFNALENVDPVAVLERFEHRRKMTSTGIFKPIEPFSP